LCVLCVCVVGVCVVCVGVGVFWCVGVCVCVCVCVWVYACIVSICLQKKNCKKNLCMSLYIAAHRCVCV